MVALLGHDRTASSYIMKRRNPPALAVWFLNRPGVSAGNEALTGDLPEEFRKQQNSELVLAPDADGNPDRL